MEIEEPLYHTSTKGLAATFGWSFRSKKRCVFLSRWQTSRLWVGFRMGPAQVKWGLKLVPVVLLVVPTGPHVKQECCWTTAWWPRHSTAPTSFLSQRLPEPVQGSWTHTYGAGPPLSWVLVWRERWEKKGGEKRKGAIKIIFPFFPVVMWALIFSNEVKQLQCLSKNLNLPPSFLCALKIKQKIQQIRPIVNSNTEL